jgi:glutamate synthase domain-containing protein 3
MGMIDLDPLEKEDVQQVKSLILNHNTYTDSSLGKSIMENWEDASKHFIKVIPVDYKRILLEKKAEKLLGTSALE